MKNQKITTYCEIKDAQNHYSDPIQIIYYITNTYFLKVYLPSHGNINVKKYNPKDEFDNEFEGFTKPYNFNNKERFFKFEMNKEEADRFLDFYKKEQEFKKLQKNIYKLGDDIAIKKKIILRTKKLKEIKTYVKQTKECKYMRCSNDSGLSWSMSNEEARNFTLN